MRVFCCLTVTVGSELPRFTLSVCCCQDLGRDAYIGTPDGMKCQIQTWKCTLQRYRITRLLGQRSVVPLFALFLYTSWSARSRSIKGSGIAGIRTSNPSRAVNGLCALIKYFKNTQQLITYSTVGLAITIQLPLGPKIGMPSVFTALPSEWIERASEKGHSSCDYLAESLVSLIELVPASLASYVLSHQRSQSDEGFTLAVHRSFPEIQRVFSADHVNCSQAAPLHGTIRLRTRFSASQLYRSYIGGRVATKIRTGYLRYVQALEQSLVCVKVPVSSKS